MNGISRDQFSGISHVVEPEFLQEVVQHDHIVGEVTDLRNGTAAPASGGELGTEVVEDIDDHTGEGTAEGISARPAGQIIFCKIGK